MKEKPKNTQSNIIELHLDDPIKYFDNLDKKFTVKWTKNEHDRLRNTSAAFVNIAPSTKIGSIVETLKKH